MSKAAKVLEQEWLYIYAYKYTYGQVKLVRPLLISVGICFLSCLILKLAKAFCLSWWIITY